MSDTNREARIVDTASVEMFTVLGQQPEAPESLGVCQQGSSAAVGFSPLQPVSGLATRNELPFESSAGLELAESQVALMGNRIAGLMTDAGVSLEEMLEELEIQRRRYYQQRYGGA